MNSFENFIVHAVRLENETMVGTTLTPPLLFRSDGFNATYAVDVQLVGHTFILKNVPISNAAGAVFYADVGSAVQLRRIPLTGKYEVMGFAKHKPGYIHRYAVDLGTGIIGGAENVGPNSRYLAVGELKDFGGGFGYCPIGAFVVYIGLTFVRLGP